MGLVRRARKGGCAELAEWRGSATDDAAAHQAVEAAHNAGELAWAPVEGSEIEPPPVGIEIGVMEILPVGDLGELL